MPITFIEAMGELQQRNIDALKAAQSAHIATLTAARDISTRIGPTVPIVSSVAQVGVAYGFRMMAEQAAYAQRFVDALFPMALPQSKAAEPHALEQPSTVAAPPQAESQMIADSSASSILLPPFSETGPDQTLAKLVTSTSPDVITDQASVPVLETSAVTSDASATIVANISPTATAPAVPSVSSFRMPPKNGRSNKPKSSR